MNKTVEIVQNEKVISTLATGEEQRIISGGQRMTLWPTEYGFDLFNCKDNNEKEEGKVVFTLVNGRSNIIIDGIIYRIKK